MTLRVLIVDDEVLARQRLRTLVGECTAPSAVVSGEATTAAQALELLRTTAFDALLLDIHMPAMNGLELAAALRGRESAPALIFVTAHTEHALRAFELDAVDYLTKPVRLDRLQAALQKAARQAQGRTDPVAAPQPGDEPFVLIQNRGRAERVALSEVLVFKAELKYVTVRTASHSYILDDSLSELEARHGERFLRVHRNALVARRAMRALERSHDPEEGEGWVLRLEGLEDRVAVSRRLVSTVREVLAGRALA